MQFPTHARIQPRNNQTGVEVRTLINNYIPHKLMDAITYHALILVKTY